ncbi:MAG: acyclic terpene utilization AtuA family protein [Ilumatobacteraceae bacterium]
MSTDRSTGTTEPRRPIRIANISGFYGDRLAAAREMLDGPDPVDVLTGDYLAELTMLILWKAQRKDPAAGYATTFLRQLDDVLATCLDRGVKIVANAGGLAPLALGEQVRSMGARLGLSPSVAVVHGDDVRDLFGEGQALTANAYLGGWGIARGLAAGADVVVTGRVTDAALVVGPAAWWHGWSTADWDRLAGAIVAGHVIECGPQATGGNYSFIDELPDHRYPGFPIAEVEHDGSSIITKQPGTGGVVTPGTVTAQLLYEVGSPAYANPDAVARFDTIALDSVGPDRVRISGVRGEPAPADLKVALNGTGGWRNTMTLVLTGLDIEAKADRAVAMLSEVLGGFEQFADHHIELVRSDHIDADTNAAATAQLRITVKDPDSQKVGRRFSGAVMELLLASYAGAFASTPPTPPSEYGVYRPALVPATSVHHTVQLPDGSSVVVPHPQASECVDIAEPPSVAPWIDGGPTRRAPLGAICGARSGDKGGNANVGLWTRSDESYRWLRSTLTVECFRTLLPEARDLRVERFELPNLRALNFVVEGILGDGVASSVRFDAQAKGLGEYLRSRYLDVPEALLARTT